MKTIKFSDTEVDLLTQLYLDELEMAENYVEQIKAVLKKLDVPIKPVKEEPIEQDPKIIRRRELKPDVKTAEKAEPKKRGRKKNVPTIDESLISAKQVEKEVEKKVEPFGKKRGRRPRLVVPPSEALPVASSEPLQKEEKKKTKRGRKSKLVIPTHETTSLASPELVKKEEKVKVEPKPKKIAKTKVKAKKKPVAKRTRKPKPSPVPTDEIAPVIASEAFQNVKKAKVEPKPKKVAKAKKKPVAKRTRKPKPEPIAPATVESVVASLLSKAPKKKDTKIAKKKPTKKRSTKGKVNVAKPRKPITKKEPEVKPAGKNVPVTPTEQS